VTPIGELPEGAVVLLYAGLIAAVGYAARKRRRALADVDIRGELPDPERHPHDLAYLSGFTEWAICSALGAMHLRGTIAGAGGVVRSAGSVEDCPNELERAVHRAATAGVRVRRLARCPEVARALASTKKRLVGAGLLRSDTQERATRRVGLWLVPVAVVGPLLALNATGIGQAISLVVGTLVAALIALVMLTVGGGRTRSGDELLAGFRAEQFAMSPEMSPDWTVHGPRGAALAIGIFGPAAVWASAPAFAADLDLERMDTATVADGGCGGCGG
jgi:uncharacterized protein (TIGR04222 family)